MIKLKLMIFSMFILLLIIACKGNRTSIDKNKNSMKDISEENMDRNEKLPTVINVYNKAVSPEYSLEFFEEWNLWFVSDDYHPLEFNSVQEFKENSRCKLNYDTLKNTIKVKMIGGGGDSYIDFDMLSNRNGIMKFILLEKTNAPEWIEMNISFCNYENEKVTLEKEITDIPINNSLFFSDNEDISILQNAIMIDISYEQSNNALTVKAMDNYVYGCGSEETLLSDLDEETKEKICGLISRIKTREVTFTWNDEKELFIKN